MKFVMAFSTGKNSMLALHRTIKEGHEPVGLIVMYNDKENRSWFHGANMPLLEEMSASLGIPLLCAVTNGNDYDIKMEQALTQAKKLGAEACVFGDIDIDEHKTWDLQRCQNAGMKGLVPLWKENRVSLVEEVINDGYKCLIKCVHTDMMPKAFLGKYLDKKLLDEMRPFGFDLCGENGEYHSVVVDGPLFSHPIKHTLGETLDFGDVSVIEINVIK